MVADDDVIVVVDIDIEPVDSLLLVGGVPVALDMCALLANKD